MLPNETPEKKIIQLYRNDHLFNVQYVVCVVFDELNQMIKCLRKSELGNITMINLMKMVRSSQQWITTH